MPISIYAKARRHILCMLFAMPLVVWVFPATVGWLGVSDQMFDGVMGGLIILWVVIGGGGCMLIRCPECGKSLFMSSFFISKVWPEDRCSRCGKDLTVVDSKD